MERSKVFIYLNSSTHSSKSSVNNSIQSVKIDPENHEVVKLKDFFNESMSESELFVNDSKLGITINNSFSSINSSLVGKLYNEIDPLDSRSPDASCNLELRELFCAVLTKLDVFEDQLKTERENYITLKKDYDNKIKKLNITNDNLSRDIDDIFDDLSFLDSRFSIFDYRIVKCEQYTRRDNLIISGIPDSISQSELEFKVLEILNRIGLDSVTSFDISACHRLFKKRGDRFPAKTVVRFTNRKIVEYCMFNKDKLNEVSDKLKMNLRFFESLCESNEEVIKMCKELHNYEFIKEYKVLRGSIRVTKPNETKQYKINHPDNLYKIFKDFYDYDNLYFT